MDDETLPFEKTRDYALSRRGFAALSLGTVTSVPPWPQTQSLHGANLVTDKPDSPHLLIPKLNRRRSFARSRSANI
jgi:hypothetical protein